jgi:mono/diheme cytochrome c family protein
MPSLRAAAFAATAAALAAILAPGPAEGADARRGRALYELNCGGCHSESVHGRGQRVAKDFAEVRAWVSRWALHLRLQWSAEEIDDVALDLNGRYYRYPCPPEVCKVVSLAPPSPSRSPF